MGWAAARPAISGAFINTPPLIADLQSIRPGYATVANECDYGHYRPDIIRGVSSELFQARRRD